MPSINQHLSDTESAREAVDNMAVRHALSAGAADRLRKFLESDPYSFTYVVCGHHDMVPEVHMPVSFAACGRADLLAWSLTQSGFEGYVVDELREACRIREIDPSTAEGVAKLDTALDWFNARIFRAWYKSSVITHGGVTYTATVDPNTTNMIVTAVDPKALELNKQIGRTVLSGRYADIFPDRVPLDPHVDVTESSITLAGRTISHPQTTIQAGTYKSKTNVGGHGDRFWLDDLVVGGPGGNATPAELPGVRSYLTGMTGLFMPRRRVRVVHAGTRWDEQDDHAFLSTKNRAKACFSIVVPIETFDEGTETTNILARGKPTCPTFLDVADIQKLQDRVLADETETEGYQSWRCNYRLDPGVAGGRLFSARVFDDPDRQWVRYENADPDVRKKYPERFRVGRPARDKEGRPCNKDGEAVLEVVPGVAGKPATSRLPTNWKRLVKWHVYDPWTQLYRVMTLDPAWKDGGNNWAITVAGVDFEGVMFQLDCISDTTGEMWIDALIAADEMWKPHIIGIGGGGMQDAIIKNKMVENPLLRRMRSRAVGLAENEASKAARIKAGVAEPLMAYRWLLSPDNSVDAREEMRNYKGGRKDVDGIIDSMSMVPAVMRRSKKPEDKKEARARAIAAQRSYAQSVDPILGVPSAA